MRESRTWDELSDIDLFFYYGEIDLDLAAEHDVALGLVQPKRSLFYNREDSAGVTEYENHPSSVYSDIMMRYDIASWIAARNQIVSDGQDGSIDRRIVTSQNVIKIERKGGEMNVHVPIVRLANIGELSTVSVPIGGSE